MSKKSSYVGFFSVAAVLLGIATLVAWLALSADPEVAKLDAMRRQMFQQEGGPKESDLREFRQRVEQLSDSQRRAFFFRARPDVMRMMQARMDQFFDRSPEEQQREAAERANEIIAKRQEDSSADTGRGPGGKFGEMTEDQRDAFRKQMLDRIDPQVRAQVSEYRRLVNQELEAQGEPPVEGREMRTLLGGPPSRSS